MATHAPVESSNPQIFLKMDLRHCATGAGCLIRKLPEFALYQFQLLPRHHQTKPFKIKLGAYSGIDLERGLKIF